MTLFNVGRDKRFYSNDRNMFNIRLSSFKRAGRMMKYVYVIQIFKTRTTQISHFICHQKDEGVTVGWSVSGSMVVRWEMKKLVWNKIRNLIIKMNDISTYQDSGTGEAQVDIGGSRNFSPGYGGH